MNDMSSVIIPKSDQINADDLIAGPTTITINEVRIKAGEEQPVDIYFEGSKKAFRPCKSMSRVLVHIWGPDAGKYIGRSLTLYRDPNVRFGKDAVGGIRISHMTDIPADKLDDGRVIMSLTATRAQRKPHVVLPLPDTPKPAADDLGAWAHKFIAAVGRAPSLEKLNAYADSMSGKLEALALEIPEAHEAAMAALNAKRASFATDDDDPFGEAGEGGGIR